MFFTTCGRIVAWVAFVAGLSRIGLSLLALASDDPTLVARHYLGSRKIGEYIDQGIYVVLFAIGLGILTEISRNIAAQARQYDT